MSKGDDPAACVEIGCESGSLRPHHAAAGRDIGLVARPGVPDPLPLPGAVERWIFWRPWFLLSLGAGAIILLLALYLLANNKWLYREVALRKQQEQEIPQLAQARSSPDCPIA